MVGPCNPLHQPSAGSSLGKAVCGVFRKIVVSRAIGVRPTRPSPWHHLNLEHCSAGRDTEPLVRGVEGLLQEGAQDKLDIG